MFERFTNDARRVVVLAQEQASVLNHNYIGTEHLLLGIAALPPEAVARHVLHRFGFTVESVTADVERIIGCGDPKRASVGHIPFTPRCKEVLELSLRVSLEQQSNDIDAHHLLLGILREGNGVAAQILARADFDELRDALGATARVESVQPARTPAADEVLAAAEVLAAGAPVGTHHLLEALARLDCSMAGRALSGLGVSAKAITGQVDALDIADTTDMTPDQAAASRMTLEVTGQGTAQLVTGDPATVEVVRRLGELGGGPLSGDGPLAGPFVDLHRALGVALAALGDLLEPTAEHSPDTVRDRVRRRRD